MNRTVNAAFDTVVFDCDSTLSRIEGIDELARDKGLYQEVEKITRSAMEGTLAFDEALSTRLALIRPSRKDLIDIGRRYVDAVTEDTADVVRILMSSGIGVFVVSGGFLSSILPLTDHLGIRRKHVFANRIFFDNRGRYAGFDVASPAARAEGKKEITERLPGRKIFVGDGASDLQAKPVVGLFIGYCGVHSRAIVIAEADLIIESESMAPLLAAVFPRQAPIAAGAETVRLWEIGIRYWQNNNKTLPLTTRKV